jgi:hypothetical protein
MSKVVKVQDGNYRIVTQLNGTITLDTGAQLGSVIVTGDLVVLGNTTTVDSETLTIKDNIVYINVGETGNGITLEKAGLDIDRGNRGVVSFYYNENLSHIKNDGTIGVGSFSLIHSSGTEVNEISGLNVGSLNTQVTGGWRDLIIYTGPTVGGGTLSVSGTPDYELRVTDDDDIPNKKFINDYVAASSGSALVDRFYRYNSATSTAYNTGGRAYDTGAGDAASKIVFEVDGQTQGQFDLTGFSVNDITINDTVISTTVSNANLELRPNGSGLVQIQSAVALADLASNPSSTSGQNKLYSKATQGPGGTGINFINATTSGELISSKKALLYALLF